MAMPNLAPLLSSEDYDSAPADDIGAFIYLEDRARRSLFEFFEEDQNGNRHYPLEATYMSIVSGLSHTLDVPEIEYDSDRAHESEFTDFTRRLDFQLSQLQMQYSRFKKRSDVYLEDSDITKIKHYASQARDIIRNSGLSEKRKRAINLRLDELESELKKERRQIWPIILATSVLLSAAADLKDVSPELLSIVQSMGALVGERRLDQDENQPILPPPMKLISPPKMAVPKKQNDARVAPTSWDNDLDDEVPF